MTITKPVEFITVTLQDIETKETTQYKFPAHDTIGMSNLAVYAVREVPIDSVRTIENRTYEVNFFEWLLYKMRAC